MNNSNHRKQILYQKTEFNNHKICQLDGIFKCCKCSKNNTTIYNTKNMFQYCMFCGTPNLTQKK